MSDVNNTQSKDKKTDYKPSKKKKGSVDKANIIFFVIMIIGLILFTLILLLKSNSKTYTTTFGDNIVSTVKLTGSNNIDISITVDDITSNKHGTYTEITDDKVDNNYKITIDNDDKKKETLEMVVDESTVTLKYDDGSVVKYKENK